MAIKDTLYTYQIIKLLQNINSPIWCAIAELLYTRLIHKNIFHAYLHANIFKLCIYKASAQNNYYKKIIIACKMDFVIF